jgi:hypothetical protein
MIVFLQRIIQLLFLLSDASVNSTSAATASLLRFRLVLQEVQLRAMVLLLFLASHFTAASHACRHSVLPPVLTISGRSSDQRRDESNSVVHTTNENEPIRIRLDSVKQQALTRQCSAVDPWIRLGCIQNTRAANSRLFSCSCPNMPTQIIAARTQ